LVSYAKIERGFKVFANRVLRKMFGGNGRRLEKTA
jgi:hypothetical protein